MVAQVVWTISSHRCLVVVEVADNHKDRRRENPFNTHSKFHLKKFTMESRLKLKSTVSAFAPNAMVLAVSKVLCRNAEHAKVVVW